MPHGALGRNYGEIVLRYVWTRRKMSISEDLWALGRDKKLPTYIMGLGEDP